MAIRIAHFTDLHVTADPRKIPLTALLSKRLAGWGNLRFRGRYSSFEHAPTVARAFLTDLDEVNPDAVVFTGDMTGLALDSEFAAARACMRPLLEDPRVLGIPGNHDVYVRAAERGGAFERSFGSWLRSDLGADALPAAHRSAHPFPVVRLLDDDAAVVAIRDVRPTWPLDASGLVPADQLAALEAILELPRLEGRVVILAMHYCLRLPDGTRDHRLHRLRNDEEVLALARRCGVELIVCGHVHHRTVLRPGDATPVAIANPGSLAHDCGNRAYHLITIDGAQVYLAARRFDPAAGAFTAWDEAPMVGRLSDNVQREFADP